MFTLVIINDDYEGRKRHKFQLSAILDPPSSTTDTISNSEYIDNCDTQIIVNDLHDLMIHL